MSRLLISLNEQLLTIIIFVAIFFLWSIIRRFNDHRFIDHENGIESRPRISKKTHDFDLSHNRLIIVSHEEETGRIKSIETRQPSAVLNTIQAGMH